MQYRLFVYQKSCLLFIIFAVVFTSPTFADPYAPYPAPYERTVRQPRQSSFVNSGTQESSQMSGGTSNIQTQEPTIPSPNVLVPPNRPETRSGTHVNKEFKPWEYEKTDDQIVRDLQDSINESYIQGRIRANPLSPNRLRELRKDSIATEEALTPPAPSTGVSRFKPISLAPGASIPDIYCFPGTTTTVRFMDSTGAPWPILSYVAGRADAFTVQKAGGETEYATNMLVITPNKNFANTSLAVTLAPDNPVVIFLRASIKHEKPDYLVTFRADAPGPLAAKGVTKDTKNAVVPEIMLSFLDGIPPKGAKRMKMSAGCQAWEYEGKYYVRSNRTLIWPAYSSIVRANGAYPMRVYELPKVSSVVLDKHGTPERIRIRNEDEVGEWEQNIRGRHE